MSFRIGILGLGTVGGGLVKLIRERNEEFRRLHNVDLEIAKVCSRRNHRLKELGLDESLYCSDPQELLSSDLDCVVEVTGDVRLCELMRALLDKGIPVVTANKALLASKNKELFSSPFGHLLFFEASCLGGIPIITNFEHSLLPNQIDSIAGIFNGTSNYILSRMSKEGITFESCLKDAQDLGYAEADPTADVKGIDATQKLSLLASLAFRERLPYDLIEADGIDELDPADIRWVQSQGFAIKLISMAEKLKNGGYFAGTFPALIPDHHPLAHVDDANNAIFIDGHATGPLMFYGAGAGELPTASAVLSDVLAAALGRTRKIAQSVFTGSEKIEQLSTERQFSCFIRLKTPDQPGNLARCCNAFAESELSLKFVHQELPDQNGEARVIFMTHPHTWPALQQSLATMKREKIIVDDPVVLRTI